MPIQTTGDAVINKPLADIGGKGLFTKEIEQELLAGRIDFAVHSFKDLPVTMPLVDTANLIIAAVPQREEVSDVIIGAHTIIELPPDARVGTSSPRRKCQLLALRPDLHILPIRGNIDTRLRKLREKHYDAIILALAGLKRAQLYDSASMHVIAADQMLPAAGQGALALQCRKADAPTIAILQKLHDPPTAACVDLERQVVLRLHGDCHSPIAALATTDRKMFSLRAAVGQRDGSPPVHFAHVAGPDPQVVLDQVMQILES